jgi:hypothetical protein
LRKILLLRWGVGAIGAKNIPGGAVGGARFGVLRLSEGRVPSRDYVGRGKILVAGERGIGVAGGWLGVGWLGVGGPLLQRKCRGATTDSASKSLTTN